VTGEPSVVVVPDPDAASDAAARHIAQRLRAAAHERGRADWATTGGSASPGIYQRLAAEPLRAEVPWDRVHTWWGDDRFARRGQANSNVTAADEHLIGPLRLDASRVHPVPVDASSDNAAAAEAYAAELRAAGLPERDGFPVLDLVLLGIGPDGHLLSVFPGSEALGDNDRWVLPIPAPTHVEPHVERVTMNPRIVDVARDVLVVVFGGAKAVMLAQVFADDRDPHELPARIARRAGATWLLDEAAAAELPAELRAG
jgi:6-phosphogluconolactonase